MADDHKPQHVVIKKVKKVHNRHHGGAWKIAYADFVTAMMAFFLLMWLLSLLNKYQLEGIAKYFQKPLKEVFSKQDMIAKKEKMRPDMLGPTTENNTGAKENTRNVVDKNVGIQEKPQNAQGKVDQNQDDKTNKLKTKNDDTKDVLKNKEQQKQQLKQANTMEQLQEMKAELEAKLKNDPAVSQFQNQLNFVVTSDGLKIVLKDLENKPMFSEGKTDFQKYAVNMLNWLSQQINTYSNRLVIIGHTDSTPYANDDYYSNWELSTDRANSTRRILIKSGMSKDKILRVMGGADTDLLDKKNGGNPANRRIEIIVLTDKAAKHIEEQ